MIDTLGNRHQSAVTLRYLPLYVSTCEMRQVRFSVLATVAESDSTVRANCLNPPPPATL